MELTPGAAQFIAGSLDRIGQPGGGLRIQRSDGDRTKLRTRLVTAPQPDDTVIERDNARVFLADDVADAVATSVLDVTSNGDEYRLVLR